MQYAKLPMRTVLPMGKCIFATEDFHNNNNNFRWDLRDQVKYKKLLGHDRK